MSESKRRRKFNLLQRINPRVALKVMQLSLWEKLQEKYRLCTQENGSYSMLFINLLQDVFNPSYFTLPERKAPLIPPVVSFMPGAAHWSKILPGCIPHSEQRYSFLCFT